MKPNRQSVIKIPENDVGFVAIRNALSKWLSKYLVCIQKNKEFWGSDKVKDILKQTETKKNSELNRGGN